METPSLAQKPLALVENQSGHLRVAFASTAALKAGIRVGMTRTAACALIPELPCFDFEPDKERAALVSLGEALLQCGPQFEVSAPDGLYLDASAAPLFRGEEGLCRQILEVCQAHGYRAKVALADDAFSARALARHGDKRVLCVPPGESQRALTPLPLSALDGQESGLLAPFRSLGISTLGEVAALPPGAVVARLGAQGLRGHRLCRGEDDRPFVPEPLAEVLEEKIDLDWPAEAMEPLLFGLKTLLDRICGRLCGRAQAAVRLDFTLKLDPSGEAKVPLTLARPSSQARLLLDLARHRISDLTLPNPVTGLSVRVVEACEDRGQQLPLGDAPEGDAALEVVLSRLSTTLGEDTLFSAGLEEAHRPEGAYEAQAFRPPEREHGMLAEVDRAVTGAKRAGRSAEKKGGVRKYVHGPLQSEEALPRREVQDGRQAQLQVAPAPLPVSTQAPDGPGAALPVTELPPDLEETWLERPSRFFERPATLDAEVGEEGHLVSARLLGKRRRVEALAGPERLCGDWWEAEYARDYYRVHFEGLGPVWIFRDERDGRFYLHGMFD